MAGETRIQWRFMFLLVIGVGVAVGLAVSILNAVFDIPFPPILGGLVSCVIIAVVLASRKSSSDC